METGNPKQVAVLAVVAVAALGFAATRLGGKAVAPVAATRAATTAPPAPRRSFAPSVPCDPFSHPKLATKATKAESPESPPTAAPSSFAPKPSVLVGDLSGVPTLPTASPTAIEPVGPAAPSKGTPPPPSVAKVAIVLEAIASASETVAFLSVDGAESRPFHANERLKGAIRLLRIEDGSVTISGPQGPITLHVGERTPL